MYERVWGVYDEGTWIAREHEIKPGYFMPTGNEIHAENYDQLAAMLTTNGLVLSHTFRQHPLRPTNLKEAWRPAP